MDLAELYKMKKRWYYLDFSMEKVRNVKKLFDKIWIQIAVILAFPASILLFFKNALEKYAQRYASFVNKSSLMKNFFSIEMQWKKKSCR